MSGMMKKANETTTQGRDWDNITEADTKNGIDCRFIVEIEAGVISGKINFTSVSPGTVVRDLIIPNDFDGWRMIHALATKQATVVAEVVVRRTDWDGNQEVTPWLESAPYLFRRNQLAKIA